MTESEEELKSLLMKVKEESEKSWLNTQHSNRRGKDGSGDRFYFLGLQNHWMVTAATKLKDTCSLEGKL